MNTDNLLREIIRSVAQEGSEKTVNESPKRVSIETDVVLRSGKNVKFGSKSHIRDIDSVICDLVRIRNRQCNGSVSRARLSDAINTLRKELRAAQKRYDSNNPPPMEEA